MKRLVILAAGLLTACQPPVNETPGAFEPFVTARVQPAGCVFTELGAQTTDTALLVTREGDPDFLAYVRYKGEMLKLVPREVPDLTGDSLDVTYDVLDYLQWKVRMSAVREEGGDYVGTISLMETSVSAPMTGRCDG